MFPYRIRDYVEYRYVKEPYFRVMPAPVFRRFERAFGWHLLITAEARRMRVAVVGLGKLGAPLAAVLASKGNDVLGIDVNPEAVRRLERGPSHRCRSRGCRTSSAANAERLTRDHGARSGRGLRRDDPPRAHPVRRARRVHEHLPSRRDRTDRSSPRRTGRLSRRGRREHSDARLVRGRAPRRAGAGLRTRDRRLVGALLQPGVHRARERDPGHARAGHGPHRRVGRARRRHARGALPRASARTIRRSGA